MKKVDPISMLSHLQSSLQKLQSSALPAESQPALQDSIQQANQLSRILAENAGQERLAALYQVSQALGTTLELDKVLTQVMDAVIRLTGAERGFLVLLEPSQGSAPALPADFPENLHIRAARNFNQETLDRKEIEMSRTVLRTVIETGEGVVTTNAQTDPRFAGQESVVFYALRSILCAPLRARGHVIGMIYVDSRAQSTFFSEEDLSLLSAFATQAAIAIENAQIYTRTDQALAARVSELERLYLALQEANQAKWKFVSTVVHELRILMTSIKGYTDLLRSGSVGPVNEQQSSFLNVVRNNIERMATLVSDLSDISRAETGRMVLNFTDFSLATCLEEVLFNLKPRIDEKDQTLSVEANPDLPFIHADSNRTGQVLTNLISNAWKYTPKGGKITVRTIAQGESVRVEVTDTGIGISPEDQVQLFNQFFRSEDPAVREQQGWGLGLSITRSLIELMAGKIGVQSVLKQGSTFWITLPFTKTK